MKLNTRLSEEYPLLHGSVLAIDPGIEFGAALFDIQSRRLVSARVFKVGDFTDHLLRKLAMGSRMLEDWVDGEVFKQELREVVAVVVEWPSMFGGSVGRAVAVRGDLVKLGAAAGVLGNVYPRATSMVRIAVPVNDWKGQLPKTVVAKRIRKILKEESYRMGISHAIDAVGIGLWSLGVEI